MARFETWFSVNLNKAPQVQTIHGNVFTQDNMGNLVGVRVMKGNAEATLTGTVLGYVIREDGKTVVVNGERSGNTAYIVLPESAYAVPGRIQIAIRLVSGSTKTVLLAALGYVTRTTTGVIVDPGDVVPDLEDLLAKLDEMDAAIDDAEAATLAANTAAGNANSAASAANTAAGNANTKANLADQKATLAQQKADLADQKATLANEKAALADEKATAANDAATAANTAAGNANEEAALAQQKADAANSAASAANDAKDSILNLFAQIPVVTDFDSSKTYETGDLYVESDVIWEETGTIDRQAHFDVGDMINYRGCIYRCIQDDTDTGTISIPDEDQYYFEPYLFDPVSIEDMVESVTEKEFGSITASATQVTGNPTASFAKSGDHFNLALGIPKGDTGVGVSGVKIQHYLSTSSIALTDGVWSDDIPEYDEGCYYWARTVTTLSDNSIVNGTAYLDNALNDTYGAIAEFDEKEDTIATKIDGWFIENNILYLTANGVVVAGEDGSEGISGIGGGGGGGGGSGNDAQITMTNGMPWLSTTIRQGAALSITFGWSSLIDEVPTGNGTLKVIVNNAIRATLNVQQGNVTVPVGDYLAAGANTVRMTLTDVYGNARSLVYTVNCVAISVGTTFDDSIVYTGAFNFPYTPVGAVEKTVHFKLDGVAQSTFTTSVSNRQLTYPIPAQEHGAHSIEVWFTATINEETVESNHIYREYIYAETGETDPIIISSFHESSVSQYSTVPITYRVYDPASQETEINIYEGTALKATLTVGRDEQTYTYRALNSGAQTVKIVAGETEKTISITVAQVDIDVDAETDGLQLYLTSNGRSNAEAHPDTWTSGTVEATFTDFNWVSDGWQQDTDGVTALRVNGGARVTIPYQIFAEDFRAGGRTIELEFATKDVRNYNTPIITCMSGGRGFTVSSQDVRLASEQSVISTQFKDDEHVRLSFVVQKRAEQRLILIYINGVVSGCVRYPDGDDFSQVDPVGITLGGDDATLDVYVLRVYDHDLTRFQILNNWIADTQDGYLMLNRYDHNNIFDEYGNIVINKLPNDLPYMILNGTLPTFKGNKLSIDGEYVDPLDPTKSFTFTGATIDVQGTSSQYYARKNYKIKFGNGFVNGGQTASKYAMNADAIPVKTFTFKADVASSEGANNVELARLYNEACPYKTPYQLENSKVRQGIDGFPIVIFHNDGTDTTFLGKYNFNNDKGTEDVFGFTEGDESWEIKNNTGNRVLFKSADYSGTDWLNDFEARYPDTDPAYTDSTQLAAFAAWLVSTDREQATGNALAQSVTYTDGETSTTYTNDTAAYRLAKFRHELPDWAEVDSMLFYYLFTELFLMVDSRAKNAFPSKMGGDKWIILPYDFDTALGINNEGALVFGYNLEDTDHLTGGADVFNGQESVLWVNLRDSYGAELKAMYQDIRSTGAITYAKVEGMFETHQDKWPEAIFNEDAQYKYLDPLINDNDASYLGMLQGSKEEQRKWWLYNRFRYIDSKYNAGDALTDVIQLRGYAKADITVTPYADIYPAVKYGSYLVTARGQRNVPMTLVNPLDNVNDTEIYIYSCSQLSSVGDISGLKVGFADFSRAIKLQSLKIGDNTAGYTNGNLTELYLGNNTLLQTIDVRNCTALAQAVDISGCIAIENVYFDGTAITGLTLPNGGVVKVLHLPGTITNLTVLNQPGITDFTCPDFSNVTTLRLENVSDQFDPVEIIGDMAAGSRVRLYNFYIALASLSDAQDFYDVLDTMRGLDQNGNNMATAQLYGTIYIPSLSSEQKAALEARYPDVTVAYGELISKLYYYDYFGTTLLHTETVANGQSGTWSDTPTKPTDTAQYTYGSFAGWALTPESDTADAGARSNLTGDRNVYAAFPATVRTYTATFVKSSTDGGGTLYTQQNIPYGTTPTYGGTTPTSTQGEDFEFNGWSPTLGPITGNTTYTAVFRDVSGLSRSYLKGTLSSLDDDTITIIGKYAFRDYKKAGSKLRFREAISVDEYGFAGSSNNYTAIEELRLDKVQSVEYDGFRDARGIHYIIFGYEGDVVSSTRSGSSPSNNVSGMSYLRAIYVPDALVDSYKASVVWTQYASKIKGISEFTE